MKTLYVSDLDGTLLNANAELSPFTVSALRALSARGVRLGAATARTGSTAAGILKDSGINTPVILMNGVCVLDMESGKYIRVCRIGEQALARLTEVIHTCGLAGFMHGIENHVHSTYYESTDSPGAERFIAERQKKYGKKFTRVGDFGEIIGRGIVYYSISDRQEKLEKAAELLRETDGLRVEYYRDIYEKDCFFLEVCAAEASKSTAVEFLRERYAFDRIVGFGDNYNDIPLLRACDEFHAVGNAVEELKEMADSVIGANTDCGVARWLTENAVPEGETP